ncbi:hypothetical protein DICVIV_06040 [Dictyocaulus viviparus]|uniref:Uncharacterized protein n=1 Tax=Dictyocaulus viviparus TaxID=29172 RepID=A0A0D8XTK8_DICVI|nr:hypothetical protein DICVIV_06040 [Dictyocaulus viviparus]
MPAEIYAVRTNLDSRDRWQQFYISEAYCISIARDKRFLIYDVNHGEGFNLRRDVYMRIANAVRLLRESVTRSESFTYRQQNKWGQKCEI